MQQKLRTVGIFLIGLGVIAAVLFSVSRKIVYDANSVAIENVDFSQIADGEYAGSYKNFVVEASVKTTVKDGKITHIEMLEHFNGWGEEAEKVIDYIIEEQSLQVDSISGATVSSVAIKKAVEVSLIGE
ncbi:MAG: FMN-binding protein [Ruminococcaceae bacterium]|nr:FMN-binding protein [Oscillospiraceae bacterium]